MVKHPQSKIGYMVDGQLWLPPRRQHDNKINNAASLKATLKRQNARKKKKVSHSSGSNSVRALSKRLRFDSLIEDLKNASKQGLASGTSTICHAITTKRFGIQTHHETYFFCMARCLVIPDMENRSAIYYAAHSGHDLLVQQYLALLVLARTIRQPRRVSTNPNRQSMTVREWFGYLGYIQFFGPKELNICVLNALNDSVKAKFKHDKCTLVELRDIAMKSSWGQFVPDTLSKRLCTNTKKGKPRLNVKLDVNDELMNRDDFDADYLSDDDGDHYGYKHDDHSIYDETTIDDDDEITMQLYHLMLNSESSDDHLSVVSEDRGVLNIGSDDFESLSDWDESSWSDIHTLATDSSYVDIAAVSDGAVSTKGDDWSIVSEQSSGSQISGQLMSYSNALRFGQAMTDDMREFPTMSCIVEDDDSVTAGENTPCSCLEEAKYVIAADHDNNNVNGGGAQEDFYYIRDAQKDGRGGKNKFMFKGNQRTDRRYRYRNYDYYHHQKIGKCQSRLY